MHLRAGAPHGAGHHDPSVVRRESRVFGSPNRARPIAVHDVRDDAPRTIRSGVRPVRCGLRSGRRSARGRDAASTSRRLDRAQGRLRGMSGVCGAAVDRAEAEENLAIHEGRSLHGADLTAGTYDQRIPAAGTCRSTRAARACSDARRRRSSGRRTSLAGTAAPRRSAPARSQTSCPACFPRGAALAWSWSPAHASSPL